MKNGVRVIGEGKGGMNGNERKLDCVGEHTVQYTDTLQHCIPEIDTILLTNVTPTNLM